MRLRAKGDLEKKIETLEQQLDSVFEFILLVKSISSTFTNLPIEEIDSGVTNALRIITESTGAVKSGLYLLSSDGKQFESSHQWPRDTAGPVAQAPINVSVDAIGFFWEKISRQTFFILTSETDIPGKAKKERRWFQQNGALPVVGVQLAFHNRVYGFMMLTGYEATRWSHHSLLLLQIVADRVAGLFYRKRSEKKLLDGNRLAESLINATMDSAVLLSVSGRILKANQSFASEYNLVPELIKGNHILEYWPKGTGSRLINHMQKSISTGKQVRFQETAGGRVLEVALTPITGASGRVLKIGLFASDITALKTSEKSLKTLTSDILKSYENERNRLAADLHESVAQELACLKIYCESLSDQFPEISEEARTSFSGFSSSIKQSIDTVRSMAYDLQPPSFDQRGFIKTLYLFCEEFRRQNQIDIDFVSAGMETVSLGIDVETILHSLLQEALENIRCHSGADHVKIRLVATWPTLILRIEDNGSGFSSDKSGIESVDTKTGGLVGMKGRVEVLDGSMKILSEREKGTKLIIEIPLCPKRDSVVSVGTKGENERS